MVDRVVDVVPGRSGRARKLASANEPYFAGHFPDVPVMPGVLLCESLAQLGAVVVGDDGPPMELYEVRRARFRRPVEPGDALDLDVEVAGGGPPWSLRGTIRAGTQLVAEVEFSLAAPRGAWIHPTATVHRGAELAEGVAIEAHATVGSDVRLGADTWIGPGAVVVGRTTLGARNRVFPFATVGLPPQDLKYHGEPSTTTIGDDNTLREFVTVNPGTEAGGMATRIGSGCLFMVHSHIGHDCQVGDQIVLANSVALAGHVSVDSHAIVGGLAGVHQFARVGESALCAAGAMVSLDVPPFCTAAGDRARLFGLNVVGLKRRGFGDDVIRALKRAYRMLFHGDGARRDALAATRAAFEGSAEVARLVAFVAASERGVCRP
jgi:UDP-N-acetylglucosamine acyltransferase